MASLTQNPISFPWGDFLVAQQMRNQNQQDMYKNIQGMGQGLGQIGTDVEELQKKKMLDRIIQLMRNQGQPQQGPQLPTSGTVQQPNLSQVPPGQPFSAGGNIGQDVQMPQPIPTQPVGQQPTSGMGAPPQDNTNEVQALFTRLYPEQAAKSNFENMGGIPVTYGAGGLKVGGGASPAGSPGVFSTRMTPKEIISFQEREAARKESEDFRTSERESREAFQKTIKAGIDSEKEQRRQDGLEKSYTDRRAKILSNRSGGLGLQDAKVNQAVHLRSMINQSWNPTTKTYELPEMQQGELIIGLANLVSGSSVATMEQLKSITPKTASGDIQHLISYWTGKPLTNQPQDMIKNLVTSIDRQGSISQKLRDKYENGIRALRPKGLDEERAKAIADVDLSTSFDDVLKQSPDQGGGSGGLTPQEQEELKRLDAKYGGSK